MSSFTYYNTTRSHSSIFNVIFIAKLFQFVKNVIRAKFNANSFLIADGTLKIRISIDSKLLAVRVGKQE